MNTIELSLHEIKDLAEMAGFTISEVPDNYEEDKDDKCCAGVSVILHQFEEGIDVIDTGKFEVIAVHSADTEGCIPLGCSMESEEK